MNSLPNIAKPLQYKLFPSFVYTNFSAPILRGIELVEKHPEILELIESDQNKYGLEKKKLRVEDKFWLESNGLISLFPNEDKDIINTNLVLSPSHKRMPPIVVFIFLLVRGYLGSIKDKKSIAFIKESKSLECILNYYGIQKIPGASTILENLNLLSEETLRVIHKLTLEEALVLGVDDFKKLYFDSTRISASSAWPTESKTLTDLLNRVMVGFEIFKEHNININFPAGTEDFLISINSANTNIALSLGNKDSKRKIKKLYRKILKLVKKLLKRLGAALARAKSKIGNILPSTKKGLIGLAEHIEVDLHNIKLCASNAKSRVIDNKVVPAFQKVLGVSDQDAEIISKGTRALVFGFKPQVGRSEEGFIVSIIVPQGNSADSVQMRPITDSAINNTGVTPSVISYDDGYANKSSRESYLEQGISVVSISGSKGKAQISEEEWNSKDYIEARNKRSMAESTMAVLKGFYNLSRFSRRGRDKVTQEILTSVIFHNMNLLLLKTVN
jgi:hypothetical protein